MKACLEVRVSCAAAEPSLFLVGGGFPGTQLPIQAAFILHTISERHTDRQFCPMKFPAVSHIPETSLVFCWQKGPGFCV